MKNTIVSIAGLVIGAALLAGVYVMHQNLKQANKNNAVDGCAKIAASMVKEYFIDHVYKLCVNDKGYKTVVTE